MGVLIIQISKQPNATTPKALLSLKLFGVAPITQLMFSVIRALRLAGTTPLDFIKLYEFRLSQVCLTINKKGQSTLADYPLVITY